jgi:cytochrome P450
MKSGEKSEKPNLFEVLLTPLDEGYEVPTPDQIKDEAVSVLAAAADTTGNAMTVAAYYVANDPEIHSKLYAELVKAFPDPNATLDYLTLESLPYLTAVIKEGLRLSFGVPGRLAREVPAPGATFNGVFLPAGSYVSMSSWTLHQHKDYFPDPKKFKPERWLDVAEARRIDKAFVPFSKGTRGCVGLK